MNDLVGRHVLIYAEGGEASGFIELVKATPAFELYVVRLEDGSGGVTGPLHWAVHYGGGWWRSIGECALMDRSAIVDGSGETRTAD